MSLNGLLRNINNKLANHTTLFFKLGYDKQKTFLDSFPEPENDIQRSYYQYRCQVYSCESRFSYFLKILSSMVLYTLQKRKRGQMNLISEEKNNILYLSVNHKREMLPKEITSKPYKYIPYDSSFLMNNADRAFMRNIEVNYPHSYYFLYKVLLKIGFYSYVINKYSPREIIVHGEPSFTSSILTMYCESRGIKHIDVMHGEKAFMIRDSFFHFTDCYVWSDYHIDLFRQLRADISNFIISLPPAMQIDKSKYDVNKINTCDYKFYLAYETKKSLKILKEAVTTMERNGRSVKLRPHPFYTDMALMQEYFNEHQIENPRQFGIEESIVGSKNVISIYSTVMRQAVNAGIRVVVDDMSNQTYYNGMKELKFWLYEDNPNLLSNELSQLNND